MSDSLIQPLLQLSDLLSDIVLPNLHEIQDSQAEQRVKTDTLNRAIEDFRTEMQVRFAELRAELAACRAELAEALSKVAELSEREAKAAGPKSTLVH